MLCGLIAVRRTKGRPTMHLFARRSPRTPWSRSERGASAVEYALLVAAIAAVVVAVTLGLASIVKDAFGHTSDCVSSGGSSTSCPSNAP
jgi:pilus assembly protein Flp/PilA